MLTIFPNQVLFRNIVGEKLTILNAAVLFLVSILKHFTIAYLRYFI